MGEMYIRSQDREKLYRFGISFNTLEYSEEQISKVRNMRHTICISDGCLEEIGEYESKERCMEILDEIETAAILSNKSTAVYQMPEE